MKAAAVLALTVLAVVPVAVRADVPQSLLDDSGAVTWLGVSLGQPAGTLRATLGDPLHLSRFPEDLGRPAPPGLLPQRKARYWIGSGIAYAIVTETNGRVTEVEAFQDGLTGEIATPPDPFGNVLGAALDPIAKVHPAFVRETHDAEVDLTDRVTHPGVEVAYQFVQGRLRAIRWIDHRLAGKPLPPLSEATGDSAETAIRDGETRDQSAVDWEYAYLRFHPCDGTTDWKVAGQTLVSGKTPVDRLHVVCPSTKAERDFFFDISASFGHL